jgi:hypothetical protein
MLPGGSGLSFRDPDNFAFEIFASVLDNGALANAAATSKIRNSVRARARRCRQREPMAGAKVTFERYEYHPSTSTTTSMLPVSLLIVMVPLELRVATTMLALTSPGTSLRSETSGFGSAFG